jgi:sugar phosphate isomerase/epimerase
MMWTLSGFADEISPDLDEQCRTLRELGMTHLELRSVSGVNVLDLDDDQIEQVSRTLARFRLSVSSIASPIGKVSVRADFEEHLRRFDRALHVASVLDVPYIRIFSFFIPTGDDPDLYRDDVLKRMNALAERAQTTGVVLLHENEKKIFGDVPRRCRLLVESVSSPHLRLAWDPANFVQCGVRPFSEAFSSLRKHIEYVQIKDAILVTGQVVPAGAGDGEIPETIAAFRADGFDGFFSLEPHLAESGKFGGFSGVELFKKAHQAFVDILIAQNIKYG